MRKPPDPITFYRYPVVAGTAILAAAVSIAWWAKVDISPLLETDGVRKGQIWRLVLSILPHVNLMHLIFNLYWLWVFGTLFEEVFGHLRTLGLILLLGLGSGTADYALSEGGVGLSGVGYGLWAAAWVLSRLDERFKGAVDMQTTVLFIVWFFLCVIMTVQNVMQVGNVAHGAGAVLGALAGLAMAKVKWSKALWRGLIALTLLLVAGAAIARPYINFTKAAAVTEARLGYDALQINDNVSALKHLRHATRIDPKYAGGWYNLGIALERLERWDEAIGAFGEAARLEPGEENYRRAWQDAKEYAAAKGQ